MLPSAVPPLPDGAGEFDYDPDGVAVECMWALHVVDDFYRLEDLCGEAGECEIAGGHGDELICVGSFRGLLRLVALLLDKGVHPWWRERAECW